MTGRKLRDSRGETLVELLAAILIAALSVAVLFTCCLASSEMGKKTQAADERYYDSLSAAEGRKELAEEGEVQVGGNSTTTEVDINLYGGDGMYSYQWKGAAPGDP